jgi:hypothetical protein
MRFGDKYKFAISVDGISYRYLIPARAIIITGTRQKESSRFAKKTSEWVIYRHENFDAYNELVAKIALLNTLSTEITCRIELYDNYATLTEYPFEGYVLLNGLSINEDNGVISFTPEEKSLYAWYDEHKSDKAEIINVVKGDYPLKYDVTTVIEEYYLPNGVGYVTPTGFAKVTARIVAWSSLSNYTTDYKSNSWARNNGFLWNCIKESGPGTPDGPHEPVDDDEYWERIIGSNGKYVNIVDRVYRQTSDLPVTDNSDPANDFIHGNGTFELSFPSVTTNDSDSTKNNIYQNRYFYPTLASITKTVTFDPGLYTLMGGCFKLYDPSGPNATATNSVLDHLLKGSGLTVHSNFFEDATNPVTGATNKLNNLRLAHGQFIKGIMDYSTSCEVSLDEILKDLCNTFNLMWYISGTQLIIEHVNYFLNGFSYSSAATVYADLTDTTTYPYKWQTVFDIDGSGSDKDYKFVVDPVQK